MHEERIAHLEKSLKNFQWLTMLLLAAVLAMATMGAAFRQEEFRAKSIAAERFVIEDAGGKMLGGFDGESLLMQGKDETILSMTIKDGEPMLVIQHGKESIVMGIFGENGPVSFALFKDGSRKAILAAKK